MAFYKPAYAEFIISSAIVEFTSDTAQQQDIELLSQSKESDYIVSEVSEITHPGFADEASRLIQDSWEGWLLATPDKTILAAGGRKVIRFVLLKKLDNAEHIYRVAIKPVIRGVDNKAKIGLKVLIGYEVLVIIRPTVITPQFSAQRLGKTLSITNSGNSNVVFQNGLQCPAPDCAIPSSIRVYPGETTSVTLPLDKPVRYSVWDGIKTSEEQYD